MSAAMPEAIAQARDAARDAVAAALGDAAFLERRRDLADRAEHGLGDPIERLREFAGRAVTGQPFYAELAKREVFTLADFPVLDKATIRASFADLIHRDPRGNLPYEQLLLVRTSGSTGQPVTTVKSYEADGFIDTVLQERMLRGLGVPEQGEIIDVGLHYDGRPLVEAGTFGRAYVAWNLRGFDAASREVVAEYEAVVPFVDPVLIIGAATRIAALAAYCRDHRVTYRPAAVVSGYEHLSGEARALIESVFDCRVSSMYGTAETGLNAWSCDEGALHFPPDAIVPEVLDEDGAPVAPGGTGRMVVTALKSQVMPIFRYDTGDLAVVPTEECRCGWGTPHITRLEGRAGVAIRGRSGREYSLYWFLYEFDRVRVPDFQLVQREPGVVSVVVPRGHEVSPDALAEVRRGLPLVYRDDPDEVVFAVEPTGEFLLTRTLKRNPVVSLLDRPAVT